MKNRLALTCAIFLLATVVPQVVAAASSPALKFLPLEGVAAAGNTVLVPVEMDVSESNSFNALEAHFSLSGPATIVGVRTGDSIFSLWPVPPTYTATSWSFVGGTPSTVYGEVRLAEVAIQLTGSGTVTLALTKGQMYRGDGVGSSETVTAKPFIAQIGPAATTVSDALAEEVRRDTQQPDPFTVTLGRSDSVFNGSYFISFPASDRGSGIAYYIVREGQTETRTASTTYVLHDQTLQNPITVLAYDEAGNVRSEVLAPRTNTSMLLIVLVVIVLATLGLWWRLRGARRKRRTHSHHV